MRSNDLFGDDFSKKGRWGTRKDESSEQTQELTDREDRSSSYAVNMLPFSENMFNDLQYNIRYYIHSFYIIIILIHSPKSNIL